MEAVSNLRLQARIGVANFLMKIAPKPSKSDCNDPNPKTN